MSATEFDECAQVYNGPPAVTAEREQAWRLWKDNYVAACCDGWMSQGATDRDEILHAAAVVLTELAEVDELDWMPLGLALVGRVGAQILPAEKPLAGDAKVRFINSLRTTETSTESERTQAVAYQLGMTVQQAAKLRESVKDPATRDAPSTGQCALYRHFDQDGALLYVGIAKEPDKRGEQHRYHSKWYRFVAETVVEWHESRPAAATAERRAIEDEAPIFNNTHNRANRAAAVDYLFGALEPTASMPAVRKGGVA